MTADVLFVLTLAATLASALLAGLFFAFSVSVMGALARLPQAEGMAAMQAINRVIQNPLFFAIFFGGAAVSLALLAWTLVSPLSVGGWLFVGGALHLIGSPLITVAVNVPLNNRLDRMPADDPGAPALWARYRSRWTAWNHARAGLCLAATGAFAMALG